MAANTKEKEVTKQINQWLSLKGWCPHRTPADKLRHAAGHWITLYPEGHADWLCTRPTGAGMCELFYREDKSPTATTNKIRRAAQMKWAEDKRHQGYLVYTAPEKAEDPFGTFRQWYEDNWR